MHEIHSGLGARHNDDLGIKFSLVAWCLSLDGLTVTQLGESLFFNSDSLLVQSHFLCFITVIV